MTRAPASARRPGRRFAARWVVLGGLLALALGLGMSLAHASANQAGGTPDAVAGVAHHAPALADVAADPPCPGCIDHEDGAMMACLVTVVVVALMAAVRAAPGVRLVLRRPLARTVSSVPRGPARAPDLASLGICRT